MKINNKIKKKKYNIIYKNLISNAHINLMVN